VRKIKTREAEKDLGDENSRKNTHFPASRDSSQEENQVKTRCAIVGCTWYVNFIERESKTPGKHVNRFPIGSNPLLSGLPKAVCVSLIRRDVVR
jgi:hypothetical protein